MNLNFSRMARANETVREAAERLYPGATYDTALPQEWVNMMRDDNGLDVRGHFIMWYPQDVNAPTPLPITPEGVAMMAAATSWRYCGKRNIVEELTGLM